MTDLVFITPALVASCSLLAAPTAATGFAASNIVTGSRGERFKRSSTATTSNFDFDAGSAVKPTHIAIARADLIVKKDTATTDFRLIGSASNTFSSPETVVMSVAPANLLGTRGEDYAQTVTYSTSYRYWRFQINTAASLYHEFSKVSFGVAYDLGRDPLFTPRKQLNVQGANEGWPGYQFTFDYRGIVHATRYDFLNNLYRHRDAQSLFLYAPTYTKLLDDKTLIHARFIDGSFSIDNDYHSSMSVTFEELV